MANDLKQKVKCSCSHYISLKSNYHINKVTSKKRTEPPSENVKLYEQFKNEFNCCSKCYRVKITDLYFDKVANICACCNEISMNQDKVCKYCNTTKNVSLFERPYLTKCKQCAV